MANPEFRQRLLNGESLLGVITNLDSVDLVEVIGYCGYDYVLLDAEHAPLSDERLATMLRAARSVGLPTVVRVRDDHPKSILRACDLGADGIMVPQVETAEQARQAVGEMRYGPEGTRGLHPGTPASRWGSTSLADHMRIQNTGICAIVQIETAAGVENAPEIFRTPGLDAAVVGPADLSQSMGFHGQPGHPEVAAARDRVFAAARAAGVRYGTVASSPEQVTHFSQQGATFFTTGLLGLITAGLIDRERSLREALTRA